MRSVLILALLGLAACTSKAAEEEEKYEIVQRQNHDVGKYKYQTLCPQSKAVAAAYLDEKNEEKYKEWKLTADLDCSLANAPY